MEVQIGTNKHFHTILAFVFTFEMTKNIINCKRLIIKVSVYTKVKSEGKAVISQLLKIGIY
jgi:hypothetical protein